MVNGKYLVTFPWRPGFNPLKAKLEIADLWIRLPGLPLECWNREDFEVILRDVRDAIKLATIESWNSFQPIQCWVLKEGKRTNYTNNGFQNPRSPANYKVNKVVNEDDLKNYEFQDGDLNDKDEDFEGEGNEADEDVDDDLMDEEWEENVQANVVILNAEENVIKKTHDSSCKKKMVEDLDNMGPENSLVCK
uniref:DUF4283 domain-containing protein n=1 Tax=Nelumbo nucifera TaxID=4432 RepID=A0A822ZFF5_NELNU|nr:TPA_asm: hypothetical protein HUJ06_001513 [Nelumbo nucifera]